MTRLAQLALKVAPPWLRGKWGARFLTALVLPLDAMLELVDQGVKARFPLAGTPTALPPIGRDRGLRRGPAETDLGFGTRCARWLDDGRTAGNAWALLDQLAGYFEPTPPLLRYVSVNSSGVALWYTRFPDGTRSFLAVDPGNWNWDGQWDLRTRFWVIIYADSGNPFSDGGEWNGAGAEERSWNDGGTWGTSASPADVTGVIGVVTDWTAAHALSCHAIIALDPTSFDPTSAPGAAGMPNGDWNHWHKVVAGVAVPTRLSTARYWEINP